MASPEAGGVGLNRLTVQSYFNFYQCLIMGIVLLKEHGAKALAPCSLKYIFLISLFLSAADFAYFYALSLPGALISVVSMVRRGSVLVSFTVGAMVFREKNLRSKAVDLLLVLIGMLFLYLGTR